MRTKNPEPQFAYYAEQLKKLKLAYIHVVESRIILPDPDARAGDIGGVDFLLDVWGNTSSVLLAGGYKRSMRTMPWMRSTKTRML